MLFVPQQSPSIVRFAEFVAVVTLHVHGLPAEESALYQSTHPTRHMTKLVIVTGRDFKVLLPRQRNEFLCFALPNRERLLYVNVAPSQETGFG